MGLVFGGGGARCFAHLGVFEALREANIPVDRIVCTSSGALTGALLANAVPIGSIKNEFYKKGIRFGWLRPAPTPFSLFSQKNIVKILDDLLLQHKIEKSKIALNIVTTDLKTGEDFVFSKGRIIDGVCAAMAYPGIYKPFRYKGRYLVDGGITNCIPADVCRKRLDKNGVVISVQLESPYRRKWQPKNYLQVLARAITLSFGRQRFKLMEAYSDIVLEPLQNIGYAYTNLNFLNKKTLEHHYKLGKKETKKRIRKIKELL